MEWLDYVKTKFRLERIQLIPGKKNRWRASQGPFSCWLSSRVILPLPQAEKYNLTRMFSCFFFSLFSNSPFYSGELPFLKLRFIFFFNVFVLEMFSSSDVCSRRLKQTAAPSTHVRICTIAQAPGSPLRGYAKGNQLFSQFRLFHRCCHPDRLYIGTWRRIWTDSDIWWSLGWRPETPATLRFSPGQSLSSVSAKLSYIWLAR